MLENFNDYISIGVILAIFAFGIFIGIYTLNLKVIESNLKKEVKYYDYDKRK